MAANININNRFQLNDIVPQNNRQILVERNEQRIATQNITRIDKKIESIDKEIGDRGKYIRLLNESKIIAKKIINNLQEEMGIIKAILERRGISIIKQDGIWIENPNASNNKITNLAKEAPVSQKKVEISEQKITEVAKKIDAIEKYTEKMNIQTTTKRDVVINSYKPTGAQLSVLARYNHALNQSPSEEINVRSRYTLSNIYQSQKNICESILNNLLTKII